MERVLRERLGSLLKRFTAVVACTVAILLALWLPLLAYVHCGGMQEWKRVSSSWITGEEIRHLMRYHGATVLKITQDRVYIWRESRWIPVRKRSQG
jgi:hypothetical protein